MLYSQAAEYPAHNGVNGANHGKPYAHKRRRAAKPAPSAPTSASTSTEDARDTSPQVPTDLLNY